MESCPLTVIILAFNEEINLPGALDSVVNWADQVFVVDSYSTDGTLEVAKKFDVQLFQNPWVDWATQRNWAMDNLPLKHEWVLFLDADERISPELAAEIFKVLLNVPEDVTGFYINRKFMFLGKWLKRGGYNPNWVLRLVMYKKARVLPAGDSEYFQVDGEIRKLNNCIIHDDQKPLSFFIEKHNKISDLAAIKLFKKEKIDLQSKILKKNLEGKYRVWIKENLLVKVPLFIRPFLIFSYKYIFKLGFLDGKEGLVYFFLHDFWYPFLVDSKILEMKFKEDRRIGNKAGK